ncbi:MAG: hypothetical protein Q9184_002604 [Pyrenodesmia sp. 2 TL-2023]
MTEADFNVLGCILEKARNQSSGQDPGHTILKMNRPPSSVRMKIGITSSSLWTMMPCSSMKTGLKVLEDMFVEQWPVNDALLDVNAQVLNSGGAIDDKDVKDFVTIPNTIRCKGASTTCPREIVFTAASETTNARTAINNPFA